MTEDINKNKDNATKAPVDTAVESMRKSILEGLQKKIAEKVKAIYDADQALEVVIFNGKKARETLFDEYKDLIKEVESKKAGLTTFLKGMK